MIITKTHTKTFFLFILTCLPLVSFSQLIPIGEPELNEAILLKPFFKIAEDRTDMLGANDFYLNPSAFVPVSQFEPTQPDHNLWLRTNLQTSSDLSQNQFSISFNHLTFVDLYLYKDGRAIIHKQGGTFRERKYIDPEDNRFTFNITLEPGENYTLLLKIKHIKQYTPNFDFVFQNTFTLLPTKHKTALLNSFMLGAIAILVLYTIFLWFINRYRPHLWLLMFLLGIGLFSFATKPLFIDTFFPKHPEIGWLMILPFLHIGVIGFYLLMIDFLEIKKNDPTFYLFSKYLVIVLAILFTLSFLNNSLTGNYYLSNTINLAIPPIHLMYISYIIILLRKKLSPAQRFLIYGLVIFGIGVVFFAINYLLFQEQSVSTSQIISKTLILCISILFLAGLHKQLQQHEEEKIIVLEQLNELQTQYNSMVEMKVEERTLALKSSNVKLVQQRTQLIEKNSQIETLMDEINHRVKNNLEMLYNFNTLQLPRVEDFKSKQILNEMCGRIKAMMVANEYLRQSKKDQLVTLSTFINEISGHLQQIYDHDNHIEIIANAPEDLELSAAEALPFGLLLTELITNAYKHAFTPLHPKPQIKLTIFVLDQQLQFIFEDNGQGAEHFIKDKSMGISLIQDLTRQLKGTVTIQHQNGFSYHFIFSNVNHYAHINY